MPYKSLAGGVLFGTAALVVAACGGSSSHASSATQPPASSAPATSTPATGAPASAASAPTVMVATNAKYGQVLTDAKGFTLYTATGDTSTHSGCSGSCLVIWPPLLLPSGQAHPVAGSGIGGLGTLRVPSGVQVTYHGALLYTFHTDRSPGQVTGQGVKDSDGTWYVATVAGTSSSQPGAPTGTTPPTTTAPNSGGVSF